MLSEDHFAMSNRDISHKMWPAVDIEEEEDAYRLHADVPGLQKEDIKITVHKGLLTIEGERKENKKERKKGRFYHYERSFGAFSRSFRLPDNVDAARIKAHYRDGTLELELKKAPESKPRSIEVKVN
ncbi:MAG: Hsp20 family protein [Chitinivibrionales bacterium]|nr:Hsp20 family protein [Chitinivibrionales bacterium]MBD3356752.1 Hsp20 family protein [Chitinivibrionales bacterium]